MKKQEAILDADYDSGEQFWKFWVATQEIQGYHARVLSKRNSDGSFAMAVVLKTSDGKMWANKVVRTEQELLDEAVLAMSKLEKDFGFEFEFHDFSGCTYEQWNYRVREGTLWRIVGEEVDGG